MRVALIDYESGNLHSAAKAVSLVGAHRGAEVQVTADPEVVARADRIVLPGDGAFWKLRKGNAAYERQGARVGVQHPRAWHRG